jgi:gliding motility-associated-like protein
MKALCTFLLLALLSHRSTAQSIGGITSGAAYFCDTVNSGFISLTNFDGSIKKWQSSSNGSDWKDLINMTSTQYYLHLKITTHFRAIVQKTGFDNDTSSVCTVTVYAHGNTGNLIGGGHFCADAGLGTVQLINYSGRIINWEFQSDSSSAWFNIPNTSTSLPYANITSTKKFRAIVSSYSACPNDTTNSAKFTIDQKSLAGQLQGSDTICPGGKPIVFTLKNNLGTIVSWQTSSNNLDWKPIDSHDSSYTISQLKQTSWLKTIVKNGICPEVTSNIAIAALHSFTPPNAGPDLTITRFETVQLNASGSGSATWSPQTGIENANQFATLASPLNTQQYVLSCSDENHCSGSDTVLIQVIIPIPTGFSPNGDGVNDYFEIEKIETFPKNSFTVMNRWGQTVYHSAPYDNDWNGHASSGQALPDDVYYYVVDFGDGSPALTNAVLLKR